MAHKEEYAFFIKDGQDNKADVEETFPHPWISVSQSGCRWEGGTDTYIVTALTGIRLEMSQDTSLLTSGPGRFSTNGNFVLSEFSVGQAAATVVPEASPLWLLSLGALALQAVARRKSSGK